MILKQILKRILLWVLQIRNKILWQLDCKKIRKTISVQVKKQLPIDKNTLILIPHADDEWVGCSSLVKNGLNILLYNMDMPGGDEKIVHEARYKELLKISELCNKPLLKVGLNKLLSLIEIIKKEKPQIICVPFFFDWHPEHIEVMNVLKQALLILDYDVDIAMYQVSMPIPRNCITHINPMSKIEWKRKWKTFEEIYKSQIGIPYKRFAINERVNGAICGSYAGESFVFCNASVWLANYEDWLLTSVEIKETRMNLQSIRKINNSVNKYNQKRKWKIQK